ncbi:MAG: LysR family transcriptional regulator [Planctomycetes bacterium]|nr:LysR family transcriptional regulator [Planctomycetota bacterium]
MDRLNFHHLRYFAAVAREGSIARASRLLHVSQPSISTQLRLLERALGEQLLQKHGRGLVLTEMGRLVQGYAEQIFGLGRELVDAVRDRPAGQTLRIQVGIADVVPRALASALLAPLLQGPEPVRLLLRHDKAERLLAELAAHQLDLVVADASLRSFGRVAAFRHRLGRSAVGVFAPRRLAAPLRRRFPASLQGQGFVLPPDDSDLRRDFDTWCRERDLTVRIDAECEDWALAKTLAVAGGRLLLAPSVTADELRRVRDLVRLGDLDGVGLEYQAITVDRRVRHPAVARLLAAAQRSVFG